MRHYVIAILSATLVLSPLSAHAAGGPSRSRIWLERPWEIRYVLFIEEKGTRQSRIRIAREFNREPEAPGREKVYLSGNELLSPTVTLPVPGEQPLAVVLLAFDRAGRIINQQRALGNMSAKRNMLDDLVLIYNDAPGARPYYFADWSQGIPGDVSFSPAVCSSDDRRRYEADWDSDSYTGSFGCREWTSQLYARDRPYIDVTSYASHGSFIGELVGWSRFEDPPKPVIGRHGKTWLCLHECPAGEQPGVIPSIQAWTKKHNYPMPERPRKQPLYPNADYQDDLNE